MLSLGVCVLLVVDRRQLGDTLLQGNQHLLQLLLLRQDEVQLVRQSVLVQLYLLHIRVQLGNLHKFSCQANTNALQFGNLQKLGYPWQHADTWVAEFVQIIEFAYINYKFGSLISRRICSLISTNSQRLRSRSTPRMT